ncbi:hypothetical protein ACRALDRAFT_1083819 [Sodiomyces alcalophilus JCM 7366]|uniref:uncharacterized protein n=1 Tax=Sodiomyces alcalophilus JCM 7366 TaxID=591952 RepID=UPI0039B65E4A
MVLSQSSTLWARSGPPPYPDVTKIPTPPLQQAAIGITFAFPSLAIVIFGMRAYIRVKTRTWGIDDWLCAAALVFSILMTGPLFMFIKLNYFGWRAVDVPPFDPIPGFWWNFLVQMFYNPVLALVKASILVFLLRLGGHKQSIRYAIFTLLALNGAHAVAIFITALLQCLPLAANWDFSLRMDPDTRCIDNSFHVIASCLTILTDFLVLALPFWIFLGLKMRWAAKVAVIGIFLMGSVVAIVGIIRVVGVYNMFFGEFDPEADLFYDITVVWAVVEVNLAIICASLPAMRPLFRRWFPSLFGGSTNYNDGSRGPYYGNAYGSGMGRSPGNTLNSVSRKQDGDGVMRLKELRPNRGHHLTEITGRGDSPTGSEEEMVTYNGIMRTTNVNVAYETCSKRRSMATNESLVSTEDKDEGALPVRNPGTAL